MSEQITLSRRVWAAILGSYLLVVAVAAFAVQVNSNRIDDVIKQQENACEDRAAGRQDLRVLLGDVRDGSQKEVADSIDKYLDKKLRAIDCSDPTRSRR